MTAILALLAKVPLWSWILIAALVVIGWQRVEVGHYRAQAITLQSAALTFESAQDTNLATIAALRGTVADWAQKCTAEVHEARQQARLSIQADAKRNAESAASVKKLRESAEHDMSVKDWYEQPVPAAAVRVLAQGSGTD